MKVRCNGCNDLVKRHEALQIGKLKFICMPCHEKSFPQSHGRLFKSGIKKFKESRP